MTIFRDILNFILPPRCALCGKILKTDKGLCDDCISKIDFLNGVVCYHCGQPLPEANNAGQKLLCGNCLKSRRRIFRFSRSACVYDECSKKLIMDFKFYDKTDLAGLLAKMMYVAGKDIFSAGIDVIIHVPLHRNGLLKRRYNQSALLARELSRLTGITYDCRSVIKCRHTRPQVECSGTERLSNLRGAFEIKNPEAVAGKRILLVDDVLTTGATLKECAAAVKKFRPKSIDCLTVARAM